MTENIIAVIAWLAGACFCGILPICFSAILFFTSRKRKKVGLALSGTRKTFISTLLPDQGLVRLEGIISPNSSGIDGAPENALVYLRFKVEQYESDSDSSGWRGLVEKTKGLPFQLNDGSGIVWVNPEGLDKQLLGEGIIPNDDQIQTACKLLDISPKILRGQLRFRLWELRSGQSVSVIGGSIQGEKGFEIIRIQNQPFVISPLIGQSIETTVSTQTKKARTWAFILGIPGLLFLICGLTGALVMLIKVLTSK